MTDLRSSSACGDLERALNSPVVPASSQAVFACARDVVAGTVEAALVDSLYQVRAQVESYARIIAGIGVYSLYVKFPYNRFKGMMPKDCSAIQREVSESRLARACHAVHILCHNWTGRIWAASSIIVEPLCKAAHFFKEAATFIASHTHVGLPKEVRIGRGIVAAGLGTVLAQALVDATAAYGYDRNVNPSRIVQSMPIGFLEGVVGALIPAYLLRLGWVHALEKKHPTRTLAIIGLLDFAGTTAIRSAMELGVVRKIKQGDEYSFSGSFLEGSAMTAVSAIGGMLFFPKMARRG